MSIAAMLRRSGPVALLVHAWRALLAAACVWPLSSALRDAQARIHGDELTPGDAALLLQAVTHVPPATLLWSAGCLVLHLAFTPTLAMLWLHAMLPNRHFGVALTCALRSTPAALALGLAAAIVSGAVLGCGVYGQEIVLALMGNSAGLWVARCAAAAIALLAWLVVAIVHDRARAAVARHGVGALHALRSGWRALRTSDLAARGGLALVTLALPAAAELGARAMSGRAPPALLELLTQALLLAGTALHGTWLAHTLTGERPGHHISRRF